MIAALAHAAAVACLLKAIPPAQLLNPLKFRGRPRPSDWHMIMYSSAKSVAPKVPIFLALLAHEALGTVAPSSVLLPLAAASRSALRRLLSRSDSLRSAKIAICRPSTPVNQYPKLPPIPAKSGQTQRDSLLKKGRISMPSWSQRTARPAYNKLASKERESFRGMVTNQSRSRTEPCGPL